MKLFTYSWQFAIILVFFYMGEVISGWLDGIMVIPGSIVGMLLLLLALITKLVPLTAVEETANFFLKHMGFFFIPLGVSLLESYVLLKAVAWQLVLILLISNVLVMGITAKITEVVMRKQVNHD